MDELSVFDSTVQYLLMNYFMPTCTQKYKEEKNNP